VRRSACQPPQAEKALSALLDHGLATLAPEELFAPALKIALESNRSVYDSLYVALAVHAKTQLITADEKVANALAARFPVKWLGAL
jgi:predicted nucleic acid-binding protein